jgi:hypothetical protein
LLDYLYTDAHPALVRPWWIAIVKFMTCCKAKFCFSMFASSFLDLPFGCLSLVQAGRTCRENQAIESIPIRFGQSIAECSIIFIMQAFIELCGQLGLGSVIL